MWNSAKCYVAAWMGGEFGGEGVRVYVWLSPFTLHLRLSNIVNWFTPVLNKQFKKVYGKK